MNRQEIAMSLGYRDYDHFHVVTTGRSVPSTLKSTESDVIISEAVIATSIFVRCCTKGIRTLLHLILKNRIIVFFFSFFFFHLT